MDQFIPFEFKYRLILVAGKVDAAQRIKQYKLDFLLSLRPIPFQGKTLGINGKPPHPLIKACH